MTSRDVTLAGYATLTLAVLLLVVASAVSPRRWPTPGRVASWTMQSRTGRWALLLSWWWLGWHLFVR